uniref:Permuted single zf-CXXC unit domain-containing protein n=1 Tax=Populus trichocarpa TaxID=3694 RepID=A0A3N7EN31_POPTR|eukprot:XP_024453078.1 DEMETER-like protein 3 [Populus trichocarpa]
MKCVISWRTEHQVYELPDNHELLVWLDKREKDDSVPFLLSIWQAGETPNSSQPPVKLCNSQGSQLCDQRTCFACEDTMQDSYERKLSTHGTYFQVNEVSRPKEKKGKKEFQLLEFEAIS